MCNSGHFYMFFYSKNAQVMLKRNNNNKSVFKTINIDI